MAITTVLLDAGGVIIDESEFETLKAECITNTLSKIIPAYSIDEYFADIEQAVISFCPDAYSYVIWKHSRDDVSLFNQLYADFRTAMSEPARSVTMKMSDGLAYEVRAISSRYDLGIAGQYGREVLDLLERNAILDCFAHQHTQDDFAITKPDPRYLEQIARACGVEPEQCIMVGDRVDKDVIPARQVGMRTILIRTGLHKYQRPRYPYEMPDIVLPSVAGIAKAVEELANRKS